MLLSLDDFFFFFQAEDGIRDLIVTGVQTCALPISRSAWSRCSIASSAARSAPSTRFPAHGSTPSCASRKNCERPSTLPGRGPEPRPPEHTRGAMTEIKRAGVLGCGLMGSGIAQVAATAGYDTLVRDVSKEIWDRARAGIEKSLAKLVEKGKLPAANREAALKRLSFTTATADLKSCDIVIEAVTEDLALKNALFKEL